MSNRRPTLSPRQIEALTLDDLLGDLDPQKLAQASRTPGKTPSASLLNREAERERLIAQAAERHRAAQATLSPWIPEATIICLDRVECSHCGSMSVAPAAETLMVRFRHRRNGSTWEVANHPCQLNPALPREEKYLDRIAHACQHCYLAPDTAEWYWTGPSGSPAPSQEDPTNEQ